MTKKVHSYLMRCSFLNVHEVKGNSTRICCFEFEHSDLKAILRNGALWVMASVCARHSAPCLYWNTDTLYIGMWANGASVYTRATHCAALECRRYRGLHEPGGFECAIRLLWWLRRPEKSARRSYITCYYAIITWPVQNNHMTCTKQSRDLYTRKNKRKHFVNSYMTKHAIWA